MPKDDSYAVTGVPQTHYIDTDVLTQDELRRALKISDRQWSRYGNTFPVSHALGPQMPRYIWGEILNHLRRTGAKSAA